MLTVTKRSVDHKRRLNHFNPLLAVSTSTTRASEHVDWRERTAFDGITPQLGHARRQGQAGPAISIVRHHSC